MVGTRRRGDPSMSEDTGQSYTRSSSALNHQQDVQYTEVNDDSIGGREITSIKRQRTRSTSKLIEMEELGNRATNGNSDDDYPSKRYNGNAASRSSPARKLSNDFDCKYQPPLIRHQQMDADLIKKKQRDSISHSRSLRSLGLEEEGSSGEEEDGIGALATSVRPRTTSRDGFPGMLLRRSSRKKKALYSTLNVSTIEHAAMLPEELEHAERVARQKTKKRNGINPELRDLLIRQGKNPEDASELSQPDIYSSIKSRRRRRPKRFFDDDIHNVSQDHDSLDNSDVDQTVEKGEKNEKDDNEDHEENEEEGDDEDDDEEEEHGTRRKYSLRTKRAQPLRLVYENQQPPRQAPREIFDHLPAANVHRRRRRTRELAAQHSASPYQQRGRRTNSQGASSSGTTESDDDEAKFKRRKKRSMDKARNRCLPMNLSLNDLAKHGFANERRKIGSSLADVDPMNVDKSVMFTSVGGHQKHVRSLKEMVVFPLMYPEVFEKFHIHPPRGCLFFGPPGTGKTLMARALANECSTEGRQVAFFMRKGADCLSKWVGESERQLRLLFDQAYQMRPSIIFFDEIDGLAPVRSSRQDQIHSSIVSTLLGLMDGLDNRGEIIVIGATNRIDSIDPALRRPGRFDREFLFPLPDKKARRDILSIHTKKWSPPPTDDLLNDLAEKTVGYCGADIMALCAESALFALRRHYPQIYASSEKLKLNVNTIDIEASDFFKAMRNVVPTAQRSDASPGHALHATVKPLLLNTLRSAVTQLAKAFPPVHKKSKILKSDTPNNNPNTSNDLPHMSDSDSDIEDDNLQPSLPLSLNGLVIPQSLLSDLSSYAFRDSIVHRPRLLVCGERGDGQSSHLAPALLHDLEGIPVHLLDIPALYGMASRTPEEACSQIFREARRTSPSIIYIPNVPLWWESATSTVLHAFESLLVTLPATSPVVLIATANCSYQDLSPELSSLFCEDRSEVFVMRRPTEKERTLFFAPVFLRFAKNPPVNRLRKRMQCLEVLEKAPPPKVAELTEQEIEKIELEEESTMRSLRLFLRDVLTRLAQDRRFKVFLKPVDIEEVTDYMEVIDEPMDISSMMSKIDKHKYNNVASFVADIDLICCNALEYNPDVCAEDKAIRHRACLLKDIANAIIQEELDPEFEKLCNEVTEARRKRNANPLKFAPAYFNVLPKAKRQVHAEKSVEISGTTEDKKSSQEVKQEEPASIKSNHGPHRRKRRRSTWASGVIRKAKKRVRMEDESDVDNNDHDEEEEVSDHGGLDSEDEQDKSYFKTSLENEKENLANLDVVVENGDEDVKVVVVVSKMGPAGDATAEAINSHKDLQKDKLSVDENHDSVSTKESLEKMETSSEMTEDVLKIEAVEEIQNSSPFKQTSDMTETESSMVENVDTNLDDSKEKVEEQENENTSTANTHSSSILDAEENSHSSSILDAEENSHSSTILNAEENNEAIDQPSTVEDATNSNISELVPPHEVERMETTHDSSLNEKTTENEIEDAGKECEKSKSEADEKKKELQTVRRMTLRSRSRSHKEDEFVIPPLPPSPPLIVDEQKLKDLLRFTVQATSSFRIEELERLYSSLNRCIHRHRHDYDKSTLIQELTVDVISCVKYVTERSGTALCENTV